MLTDSIMLFFVILFVCYLIVFVNVFKNLLKFKKFLNWSSTKIFVYSFFWIVALIRIKNQLSTR